MISTSTRVRRMMTTLGIAALLSVTVASAAFAAENGNWDGNRCGDRGEACLWNGNRDASRLASSSDRDSDFRNDHFGGGTSLVLNDRAKTFDNRFSTLRVRAYHDTGYRTGSTCIGGQLAIGPYSNDGSSDGLSSFRSC